MNNELLELAEKHKKDDTEYRQNLERYLEQYNKLMLDEKKDWSNTDVFKQITDYLGPLPPIKLLEDIVSYYKAKKQALITQDIPDLLAETGFNKIDTEKYKIEIKTNISVKTKNEELLHKWLKDNGYENFIKTNVQFKRGEVKSTLLTYLEDQGYNFIKADKIEPQTLKKIIKDIIEAEIKNEEDLPDKDICTINTFGYAKITNKE